MPPKRNNCHEDYEKTIKHYQGYFFSIIATMNIPVYYFSQSQWQTLDKKIKEILCS